MTEARVPNINYQKEIKKWVSLCPSKSSIFHSHFPKISLKDDKSFNITTTYIANVKLSGPRSSQREAN